MSLTIRVQNLFDLTIDCENSGKEFIGYLHKFTSSSSSKAVRAVKTAVQVQWSSPKINNFVNQLDRLRNSLTLATVLACHSGTEGNKEEILTHLKEIQQDFRSRSLDDDVKSLQSTIDLLADAVKEQSFEKLESIQNGIQVCLTAILALRQDWMSYDGAKDRERDILKWLDFRQNSWRYEGVDHAYQKTYEWIFNESSKDLEWDSFTDHLRFDVEEPYFINGKAGSGKSTLMKFIHNHTKTKQALREWAGPRKLVVLHFFFWNLGTTLQKSHVGMLRALLHAALKQHQELIPAVFPKLYQAWEDWDTNTAPDYIELKKAFELLIERSLYLRLVIFIDGLDEFEGDHRDVALFLRSLASPRVKIIASSRPLNTCLESLAGSPTLRLQDLTRRDMKLYVDGELSTHRLMARLVQEFPEKAPCLVSGILSKAEGVFLWTRLVVRLLIQGLENGDNLEELQQRLTTLPSGLRDLYKRIFAKLDIGYQKEAAILFQMNERWLTIVQDQSLPGITLWYAIHSPLAVLKQNIALLPSQTYDWAMSSLIKRIQSRCCGLLELRRTERTLDGTSRITLPGDLVSIADACHLVVTYLHRTVHEFITDGEVWADICNLTTDLEYSIAARLAAASLSTMKLTTQFGDNLHHEFVNIFTKLCRETVDTSPALGHSYIMELDRTMIELSSPYRFHQRLEPLFSTDDPSHWSENLYEMPTILFASTNFYDMPTVSFAPGVLTQANIYTYAAGLGLLAETMPAPFGMDDQRRLEITLHAIASWRETGRLGPLHKPSMEHKIRTLKYVFAHCMPPEGELFHTSLWKIVLSVCSTLRHGGHHLEAAHLLKTTLSSSESPELLWLELDQTKCDYPSIIKSLRQQLRGRDGIKLVDDIEKLSKPNESAVDNETSPHPLPQPNTESRNRPRKRKITRQVILLTSGMKK
jgi:hypothetical protein